MNIYCDLHGRIKGSAHAIKAVYSSVCCMTNIVWTISVIQHTKKSRAICLKCWQPVTIAMQKLHGNYSDRTVTPMDTASTQTRDISAARTMQKQIITQLAIALVLLMF